MIVDKILWREVVSKVSTGTGSPFTLTKEHLEYLKSMRTLAELKCLDRHSSVSGRTTTGAVFVSPVAIQNLINIINDHGSVMVMD